MYLLRWILFRRIRKGAELLGIVRKHYRHQKDVLPQKNRIELESGIQAYEAALKSPSTSPAELKQVGDKLEETAHAWLKPYAFASYRENFESLLGTVVIIFAFKTFFATPMEIPTGSAQPTYNGITYEDLRNKPEVPIPSGLNRIWEHWIKGNSYYEIIAQEDGDLESVTPPRKQVAVGNVGFGKRTDIKVGSRVYSVAWSPESPETQLALVDPISHNPYKTHFKRGEPIIRCRVQGGDRLFVERISYNFRKPRRGEYFVFQSTGLPYPVTQGTHYIKRLIAFGGERVRIGNDRHVYINDRRLEKTDPGFEKVYSFDPAQPPVDSHYSGHVNGETYRVAFKQWLMSTPRGGVDSEHLEQWADKMSQLYAEGVGRYFPDERTVFTVHPNCYLGFGDNTMSSSDGRAWGDVPREKVIGKALFVMWPFTSRWGF